jgi:prophage regulatory protein
MNSRRLEHTMRLLTKRQVKDLVCYSFAHIDRLEAQGRFPKRVRLGAMRVAWVETEVQEWIAGLIAKRDSAV